MMNLRFWMVLINTSERIREKKEEVGPDGEPI